MKKITHFRSVDENSRIFIKNLQNLSNKHQFKFTCMHNRWINECFDILSLVLTGNSYITLVHKNLSRMTFFENELEHIEMYEITEDVDPQYFI